MPHDREPLNVAVLDSDTKSEERSGFSASSSAAPPLASAPDAPASGLRVHEIDGVRGWAALSVVLFHMAWELFGGAVPVFRSAALHFWLNGPLAVSIFFVLSGDALSWPFLRSGDSRVLDVIVVKRYFRLAIPIFYSALIGYLAMRSGLVFNHEAAAVLPNAWLGGFLSFTPSVRSLLNFSFSQVFFDFASYPNSYNRFLWPMPIELAGSCLVFSVCYAVAHRRQALQLTLVGLGVALVISEFFGLFFAGVAFAMMRRRGIFEDLRGSIAGRFIAPVLILLAIAADTLDYRLGMYLNASTAWPGRFHALLAIAIVLSVYSNRALVEFFGNRVSRWLGTLSFPIYLLHFAVMCSLTSFLIVQAHAAGRQGAGTYAAIVAVSVAVTLAAASVFERLERHSLRAVDRAVRSALEQYPR